MKFIRNVTLPLCILLQSKIVLLDSKYKLGKKLGSGGFATVLQAEDCVTGEKVAAKVFYDCKDNQEAIHQEVDMLRKVGRHEHIVGMKDFIENEQQCILILDLVPGGELFDYIVGKGSLSEKEASRLLRDICLGIQHIHRADVSHRDLKPENILMTDASESGDIKIADFGLSKCQTKGVKSTECVQSGTWAYWAPEVILKNPQDQAVDMWAFGLLVYIVLVGFHPFDPSGQLSDAEILSRIVNGKFDTQNPWYQNLSAAAKDFISNLLRFDQDERYTADQAMRHPWLQGEAATSTLLSEGHTARLQGYKRLQKLRANVLAMMLHFEPHRASETQDAVIQAATQENVDIYRETFRLFDKDMSGTICKKELSEMFLALGQSVSPEEAETIFKAVDTNNDGEISFTEFTLMMQHQLHSRKKLTQTDLRAAFHAFDRNDDGFISSDELVHILKILGTTNVTKKEAETMIAEIDVNHDGKIDYNEFVTLMCTLIN